MPMRTIASLAIAIFLGLIAVVLVRGLLVSRQPGGAVNTAAMTPIVVAALPIERGVALNPAMLKVVSYPKDSVPAGAFQSLDQLVGKNAPARATQRSIIANEPVLSSKLSGAGAKTNLSSAIQPGMRAVSVRSTDVSGVGGFVLPGDRVDVLLTRSVAGGGETASTVTQVLAENVVVLGVDQTSDQEAEKPIVAKAVTVQVTPDQAQTISLGQTVGQISLALRQSADNAALVRRATTVADFGTFGHAAPHGPVKRARPRMAPSLTEVHVVRGVDTTSYSVGMY